MCTICDLRIEFSIDHPMSLSVAVDTRRAIDVGLLPETESQNDPLSGMRTRLGAIETLKAAQARLEHVLCEKELLALPDFFALMIESRTWGYFRPTPNGFDPNCRPEPPNVFADDAVDRDVTLVASETAMRQMVAGKLPFEKGLEEGVILLDADPCRRDRLLDAWSRAYPKIGFSRFVCA